MNRCRLTLVVRVGLIGLLLLLAVLPTMAVRSVAAQGKPSSATGATTPHASTAAIPCQVTSNGDNGIGSLREKVADASCSRITFATGIGTITLASQISINRSVEIDGESTGVKISGNNATRIFLITAGTAKLYNLTVQQGQANAGGAVFINSGGTASISQTRVLSSSSRIIGGGIYNSGTLAISQSTLSGNLSFDGAGGIYNDGGTLTISQSTLSGNSARYAGGIWTNASITIRQSTFAGNSATVTGGGIIIASSAQVLIEESSISKNTVTDGTGGGIKTEDTATLTLKASVVADNSASSTGKDVHHTSSRVITSQGYNLIGNNSTVTTQFPAGAPNANNDYVGTEASPLDPKLGTLVNNGGLTQTMLPLAGSPAIDNGPATSTYSTDQRGTGYVRKFGTNVDIGAVEVQPTTTVSIANAIVTEGTSGSNNLRLMVSLSAASTSAVTVQYSTSDGTASAPADYTAVSNQTITFNAGETSKVISIPIVTDSVDEADETFSVTLSNASGANISPTAGSATATIFDDDATPSLSIADSSVIEGNDGTRTMPFTVTLSAVSGRDVIVSVETSDGTATSPSDYVGFSACCARPTDALTPGVLIIPAGQTTGVINVTINGDLLGEGNETFTATITNASDAIIGDGTATGTIIDDELSISITDSSLRQPRIGMGTMVFTVTLSQASATTVTVNYTTMDGTATNPDDYMATTGTITFAPGETSKTIDVSIVGDGILEPNRQFMVKLSNPSSNAWIADSDAVGTIIDRGQVYYFPLILKNS